MKEEIDDIIKVIKSGKLVVMPTDTIWGILADARNALAIDKMYTTRPRNVHKPCIVLIEDLAHIENIFEIPLSQTHRKVLEVLWHETATPYQKQQQLLSIFPEKMCRVMDFRRPVSVVLPSVGTRFAMIHRGTYTIAFRKPRYTLAPALREILAQTGPLLAPSANPEGQKPAQTQEEAQKYFGDAVALYRSDKQEKYPFTHPSHVIQWSNNTWKQLR